MDIVDHNPKHSPTLQCYSSTDRGSSLKCEYHVLYIYAKTYTSYQIRLWPRRGQRLTTPPLRSASNPSPAINRGDCITASTTTTQWRQPTQRWWPTPSSLPSSYHLTTHHLTPMYSEPAAPPVDPYLDAYNAPPAAAAPTSANEGRDAPRGRSRSRSPLRRSGNRSPTFEGPRRSPPPMHPPHAPIQAPNSSNVLGVFSLSIHTTESDPNEELGLVTSKKLRFDWSCGFGFEHRWGHNEVHWLNSIDLNGQRIRVDYSVTDRPHTPTPGEYMGQGRSSSQDSNRAGLS